MSFPTRERGLKSADLKLEVDCMLSFPTRERGLKSLFVVTENGNDVVIPHAGTWIEI